MNMVEPQEQVRNLTSAPRQLAIDIEGSVVFELILTMWSTFNPHESNTAFDLGRGWQEKIAKLTPPELKEEIERLGGPYLATWLGIAGLLQTAPHPHDPETVIDWLEELDPKRLTRWLLEYANEHGVASQIEAAANGDSEALEQLFEDLPEEKKSKIKEFFSIPSEELPGRYAKAMREFRTKVFAENEEEFGAAIGRAAAARRAHAIRSDASALIEEVTKGLNYEIPIGVSRVVLVPSVVTKPLSIIDQHRGTLTVYYGIADEFLDADPEAPPSWMVRAYKALGDERRLRILRRLSEGETTLDELTEMLGLSKSTVHHHISILRGAGLVRVHVAAKEKKMKGSRYTLREEALEDASGFLDSYLRTEEGAASA